jgi:hypothetical protein
VSLLTQEFASVTEKINRPVSIDDKFKLTILPFQLYEYGGVPVVIIALTDPLLKLQFELDLETVVVKAG